MKVMAIGAHPDDIEFGCGGSLLKHKEKGDELLFVIATRGEMGSLCTESETLAEIRSEEARLAALGFGAELVFLNLKDGLCSFAEEDKVKLIKIIRNFRPEVCYIHGKQDLFPDHALIHNLSLSALTGASGSWYQVAGGLPHEVKEILGYEVWNPFGSWGRVIDISETLEEKVAALEKHKSQLEFISYDKAARGLAHYRGAMARKEACEVFEVLRA